jgi:hypothetical protein
MNNEEMHFAAMWASALVKLKRAADAEQELTLDAEETKALLRGIRLGYARPAGAT